MYFDNSDNFKVNFVSDIEKIKRKHYSKAEPYICPVCQKVWQHFAGYYGKLCTKGNITVEYLKGFPKFGCSKNICKNCE